MRLPSINAAASAATPELICTAVPPAKSSTPQLTINAPGPPQTICAIGAYTSTNQAAMNSNEALNFMRSAKPPAISAGVMMAKVSWNTANTPSGMLPTRLSWPMSSISALSSPPMKLLTVNCPSTMPVVSTTRL
ncbi:hypothetical protein D3C75_861850 [compost metagenome]